MVAIFQSKIPYDVSLERALPAISALDPAQWLIVDDAYVGQMAERERLLSTQRDVVTVLDEGARASAEELLSEVLKFLNTLAEFTIKQDHVTCPDGRHVRVDPSDPLATLGRLVQNDFCILQKVDGEHVLTGAVLCFPASWSLSEKFMRPLSIIHEPVKTYDDNITKRVQRLFDGIKSGHPLWRFNALNYATPELFQPRSQNDRRKIPQKTEARFFRSERQTLIRLPKTGAVVFGIHTFILKNY
ncbi:MAG: DUF3445 domain-containing protein [Paracoccaceae bacterium]